MTAEQIAELLDDADDAGPLSRYPDFHQMAAWLMTHRERLLAALGGRYDGTLSPFLGRDEPSRDVWIFDPKDEPVEPVARSAKYQQWLDALPADQKQHDTETPQ